MKSRAYVKDEQTYTEPFFVYVESQSGVTGGELRFNTRRQAERVAKAVNKAYEAEGRLLT